MVHDLNFLDKYFRFILQSPLNQSQGLHYIILVSLIKLKSQHQKSTQAMLLTEFQLLFNYLTFKWKSEMSQFCNCHSLYSNTFCPRSPTTLWIIIFQSRERVVSLRFNVCKGTLIKTACDLPRSRTPAEPCCHLTALPPDVLCICSVLFGGCIVSVLKDSNCLNDIK